MIKKITILLIIVISLNSCARVKWLFFPRRVLNIKADNNNSAILLKGLYDGCETLFAARGNSFMRMMFKLQIDEKLMLIDGYWQGWQQGSQHCFLPAIVEHGRLDKDADTSVSKWLGSRGQAGVFDNKWFGGGLDINLGGGHKVQIPGEGESLNFWESRCTISWGGCRDE